MTEHDPAGTAAGVLTAVLEDSRGFGFLGPGPLAPQIEHARGFASMVERAPESFLDLGAGGGLPGLVLALHWPQTTGVLLDAMTRRSGFLRDACERLGLGERIRVVCARAEDGARDPALRAQFELVVARSFGSPAVTAECGAGFLAPDGALIVSEPPDDEPQRWPAGGLELLGLTLEQAPRPESRYVVVRRTGAVDERYPRRTGIPRKRPLWP